MKRKLKNHDELRQIIQDLRAAGKRVVFTNGCFDIIHTGHVRYLNVAKGYGDVLVVAINSDESVQRLKGPKRPIMTQEERAEVLAALGMVDYVTVFEEDDPHHVIAELMPDVLVKGGDWALDAIVGREFVEGRGGRVVTIPLVPGRSTTGLLDRIGGGAP